MPADLKTGCERHEVFTGKKGKLCPDDENNMKNGALFDDLPDWIPIEAWQGWLEMRRQKRIPMTDGARNLALRTLARLRDKGEVVEYVLGQSEFKGWSGLFPVGEEYYQMLGIPKPLNKSAVILKMTDRTWAERNS